jgi:1,2-diacylglycerol 3-beta-glucosyltransferase
VASRAEADPLVHLVSRREPEARTGKGDALNAAYWALNEWLPMSADRTGIIVGVVDADGRPAANCLAVCAGGTLFGDPGVGSVQILARMLNRDDPRPFPRRGRFVNFLGQTLVRLQDVEFRVPIAAIQVARRRTGTVGLGGNGQFSRLSAELAPVPILPDKALPLTLGGLGVLLIGGMGYRVTRRSRLAAA